MIRQAHTYLVGALGGATLIAVAIAAFVMLVSAQVFTDWPLAGLGKSSDDGVSAAKVVDAPDGGAAAGGAAGAGTAASTTAAGTKAGSGSGAGAGADGGGPTVGESRGSVEAGGGEPAAGGGGSEGGSGNAPAAQTPPASSGGGSTTSPSGGGSSAASSPSQTVTSTVNDTVNKVDQTVTGGTLEKTGATGVTEGVVDDVVGPESVVGQVVDETVGTVEGILGGKR